MLIEQNNKITVHNVDDELLSAKLFQEAEKLMC
jgi:hypothetical protein